MKTYIINNTILTAAQIARAIQSAKAGETKFQQAYCLTNSEERSELAKYIDSLLEHKCAELWSEVYAYRREITTKYSPILDVVLTWDIETLF